MARTDPIQTTSSQHAATSMGSTQLPDLERVRSFMMAAIARGSFAELVAAVLTFIGALVTFNAELIARDAQRRRARPPAESLRRLQLEIDFAAAPTVSRDGQAEQAADADVEAGTASHDDGSQGATGPKNPDKTKRGPRNATAHGRAHFPSHLPRVPLVLEVPLDARTCPACGVECDLVTHKILGERLTLRPAEFIVEQSMAEVLACKDGCREYITQAPASDCVVPGGALGDELLIEAMVSHFMEATPYERIEEQARAQGAPLSAETLSRGVGALVDRLDPIVQHLEKTVFESAEFAFDPTGIRVLDDAHPLNVRTGSLWHFTTAAGDAFFSFAPTGHAVHLETLLLGKKIDVALCDGSATNNSVEKLGAKRAGCHSHSRRGLVAALRGRDMRAREGIALYAELFAIEVEATRALDSPAQRLARRKEKSAPIWRRFIAWVDAASADVEPKSVLGRALAYIRRQRARLEVFLARGDVELTNNRTERGLRRHVLGRKTWYFVGHDENGRRAAAAYSVLVTCRNLGVDPRAYLRDIVPRLLGGEKDLGELLPRTFRVRQDEVRARRDVHAAETDASALAA